jgi:hypothetical protein
MKRERRERSLQHLVVPGCVMVAVLPLVKVVVDIQLAKIRAGHECIAPPHEVGADLKALRIRG